MLLVGLVSVGNPACSGPRRQPLPPAQLKELFHVTLAYAAPGAGRTASVLSGPSGPETLYVQDGEVFSLAHVQKVSYTTVDTYKVLAFLLTAEGRSRMASASKDHIGGRMAIFVEGKLHSAPVVQAPILGGEFHISGGVHSDEQLRALQQKLMSALGY